MHRTRVDESLGSSNEKHVDQLPAGVLQEILLTRGARNGKRHVCGYGTLNFL